MKKYFKCVYELKNKISDKRWLFGKVYHKGTFRGFFESKKECIEYAKKIENCKKVISIFNNDDILQLAKDLKNKLNTGIISERIKELFEKSDKYITTRCR